MDPGRRIEAEEKVSHQVATLFGAEEDLLQEFSQFLSKTSGVAWPRVPLGGGELSVRSDLQSDLVDPDQSDSSCNAFRSDSSRKYKRLAPASSIGSQPTTCKKPRPRDTSVLGINQLATLSDIQFLNKIQTALDSNTANGNRVYQNFLQRLNLFSRGSITASQLLDSIRPNLVKHTELWRTFHDIIRNITPDQQSGSDCVDVKETSTNDTSQTTGQLLSGLLNPSKPPPSSSLLVQDVSAAADSTTGRIDIDFRQMNSCGVSYRALPPNMLPANCSGRAKCPIAKEVLNDIYMSFSSLSSEDSQFVSSKKNQYEENMYRVEDERYEVDMVTELNRAAMENLAVVKRQLDRMSRDALNSYRLDDYLGGTSAILMRKAIHRIYGDKAADVIHGMKSCPNSVVPLVIKRMRQKDAEWKEAIRVFKRSWAEQDAHNYLRALDHQGATFKQRDLPYIKSKLMISQLEAVAQKDKPSSTTSDDPIGDLLHASLTQVDQCQDRFANGLPGAMGSPLGQLIEGSTGNGPHLTLVYPPREARSSLLADASSLIIHHVKRQSNCNKEDKRTIKFLIRAIVQDVFHEPRFPMSDDEDDNETDEKENSSAARSFQTSSYCDDSLKSSRKSSRQECYSLLYGCNHWYAFIRLHHLLLCRLHHLRERSLTLVANADAQKTQIVTDQRPPCLVSEESVRSRRQLNSILNLDVRKYYETALELVKDLLDGGEDINRFEDRLREMFDIYAYPWFTMDRVIGTIVRELHALVSSEDFSRRLINLFRSCNTPSSSLESGKICSGVCGPLTTRIARLPAEANYRNQMLTLCTVCSQNGASNNNNQSSVSLSSIPNCCALVTLREASMVLIRLIKNDEFTRFFYHNNHNQQQFNGGEIECADNAPLHDSSRWLTYFTHQLKSDSVAMTRLVDAITKPVFLFRSVKRCIRFFTKQAFARRQQSLLITGDTQPEELLMRPHNTTSKSSAMNVDSNNPTDGQEVSDSSSNIDDLIQSVFVNTLTRRELYRNTMSTDCMQSIGWSAPKTSSASQKAHKINWSVGSYGIFIRKRQSTTSTAHRSIERWKAFHDKWLLSSQACSPDRSSSNANSPIGSTTMEVEEDTTRVEETQPMECDSVEAASPIQD